jgi:signal transduction protein with GAF and PtsI domain
MPNSEREIGRLAGAVEAVAERLDRMDVKLDKHVEDEEARLLHIEHQLSLARFLFLSVKAIVLTVIFLLAFKFGDIKSLWKALT